MGTGVKNGVWYQEQWLKRYREEPAVFVCGGWCVCAPALAPALS